MNKQHLLLSALLAGLFSPLPVKALSIQTLLEEDFQGVDNFNGNANTVRTVSYANTNEQWNPLNCASALSAPSSCANPLIEDVLTSFTNVGSGNASANSFNIRLGSNPIDGNTGPAVFGDNDFDNFFGSSANKFLVLGDDSGNLSGDPNGGTTSGSSLMQIDFPLFAAQGAPLWLTIEFDYAFDANNTNNSDDFWVELVLADNSTISLLNHTAPSDTTRGTFSTMIAFPSVAPTALRFKLKEYAGTGSSAVGIDNIAVRAIPEPASLALFGLGLLGLGGMWAGRQKI
jgi:hypothetical protein